MHTNFIGQPFSCLGISNHMRDLVREIINQNPDTTIYPLFPAAAVDQYDITPELSSRMGTLSLGDKLTGLVFAFWTPDAIEKLAPLVDRSKSLLVCYFVFEWTKLSEQHKRGISLADYIAVPSEFHRQVLLDNGIDGNKIIILRAGVSPAFLKDYDVERRHKFLFVGKYEARKCVDETIKSFLKVVTPEMGSLTFLCRDPHKPEWDVVKYLNLNGIPNIDVGQRPSNPEEMARLYASHQYLLLPSRAGGIELPLIESMAQGVVPIVTKTSGMQCYMPEGYHWFIPVKEMVPMYDQRWFPPTTDWGIWASPSWIDFEDLLRKASSIKPIEESKLLQARARSEYNYIHIVKDLLTWADLAYKRKHMVVACS